MPSKPRPQGAVVVPMLCLALLVATGVPSVGAETSASPADSLADSKASEQPCEGFRNQTTTAGKCSFILRHCDEEGLWKPLSLYYCNAVPNGLGVALLLASGLWLFVLFQALGSTADNFFSPILTQLSQDLGLPPRFAGVTFLALGNGAPDLSSTILAISSGDYNLALGALTGAGMFVGTCVAGACVLTANGAKCRGALVRDVSGYAAAIVTVVLFMLDGYVSYLEVVALCIIYVVFMFSVLGADLWHRLVHLKKHPDAHPPRGGDMELAHTPDSDSQASGRRTPQEVEEVASPSAAEVNAVLGEHDTRDSPPKVDYAHMKPARYRDLAWATLAKSKSFFKREPSLTALREQLYAAGDLSESFMHQDSSIFRWTQSITEEVIPEDHPEQRLLDAQLRESDSDLDSESQASAYAPPSLAQGGGGGSSSVDTPDFVPHPGSSLPDRHAVVGRSADGHRTPASERSLSGWQRRPEMDEEQPSGPVWASFVASQGEEGEVVWGTRQTWYGAVAERVCGFGHELATGLLMEPWEDVREMGLFGKITLLLLLPFTVSQRATIPIIVDEAYSRAWLLVSITLCPVWMAYTLGLWHMPAVIWAATLSASLGLAVLAGLTSSKDVPPEWNCGCRILIGAALMCTAGFIVAATWIAFVAQELVAMLQFFGRLSGVNSAVLGLTVLAWGNSIGDLSTNIAMAKRGLSNMALTACFAGPLFNLLVGCGLGFARWLSVNRKSAVPAQLDSSVVVGCVFIVINCTSIVVKGLSNRGVIPRSFGYFMIAIYALYVATSLMMLVLL